MRQRSNKIKLRHLVVKLHVFSFCNSVHYHNINLINKCFFKTWQEAEEKIRNEYPNMTVSRQLVKENSKNDSR